MFFWGIISNIFWAFVIAIVLWVFCTFAGRLVNPNYRMTVWLHLLCFVTAVPTVVLLTVVFSCNKINHKVLEVDAGIAKLLMTDNRFVDHLRQEITQASSTKNADGLTKYITEKISSEYSVVGKYMDMNNLLEKTDMGNQIAKLTQGGTTTENIQIIMQGVVDEFTKGIRLKIRTVRNKALIAMLMLQVLSFGIVFYRASQYRSSTYMVNLYQSNDYL